MVVRNQVLIHSTLIVLDRNTRLLSFVAFERSIAVGLTGKQSKDSVPALM